MPDFGGEVVADLAEDSPATSPSAEDSRSVRLAGYLVAAGADQEVEVRAVAGLHDVVDVEALPAAGRGGVAGHGGGGRLAPPQDLRLDLHVQPPGRDVEADEVAGLDQAQGTPVRGLGRDVQDHGAVRGAAHP